MDNNKRNSAVPIRAHLASIEVVGNLEGKSTKRPDHFVKVYVDDLEKDVTMSDKKPRIPSPQWQWPEAYQFQFHPSSTIKIAIHRESRIRVQKHLVGQYNGKVIDLLENNATIDLKNEAGVEITAKFKINLSLVPEPQDNLTNFMKTVDDDVSRLRVPPGVLEFGKALQTAKNILDIVANADPTPILKATLAIMSVVYGAINRTEELDDTVRDLTENLREVLCIAKEYPDSLNPIEGTPDVIEEIGRTSLKVVSLLHEYTGFPTYAGRLLKSQLSDDMKSRIIKCQKSLDDLKQKFDRRLNIDTNRQLRFIKDDQLANKIDQWLSAPDTSRNYNEAREKYQKGTSSWFLDGPRFRELQEKGDFLWIKGTAGCGKTLLCSSVIDKIIKLHKENASIAYAYFFFDGRDSQKGLQLHEQLIRSLVSQLSRQCDGIPAPLAELYYSGHGQQPSTDSLQNTLHNIIDGLHSVYIVIDSLDECTKAERRKTLQWVHQIISRPNLHMVVASRPERDIIDVLLPFDAHSIDLPEEVANHDISMYLEQQLSLENKWDEETRNIVKSTLTERAHGMFRWVALQLNELKECSTPRAVREQLNALPRDLHETYDRILLKVNEADRTDTKTFLRWLCFSVRRMELAEIAEAVVVDIDDENGPRYEPLRRYWDPKDVLTKCSSLVTESEGFVKLAHFSIKEYLLSERLQMGPVSHFHLTSDELSHSLISQTSLAYILQFGIFESLEAIESFPLARYAAERWIFHAQAGGIDKPEPSMTLTLAKRLFAPNEAVFTNWVRIWDLDDPYRDFNKTNIATPLYYASLAGLQQVSLHLLKGVNVNTPGGKYGNALQAASLRGREASVKMLLEHGADSNAQGGEYGNALQAAAVRENNRWGFFSSPEQSHEAQAIAKLLLEHGANPNAQGGRYGSALQAASFCEHEALVKFLLENGADANAQGGKYGNALQAASFQGHQVGVKLLLQHGADANAQGGEYGNALQAASFGGHKAIVELLLENGVDPNAPGGKYSNALHAAANHEVHSWEVKPSPGHEAVVKLLLEHGASPNAQGQALHTASFRGHEAIVKLLLENGADPNTQAGKYGNALYAAANHDIHGWDVKRSLEHEAIVKLLLEHGANPNMQGGEDGQALHAASFRGHEVIVKLLLENGANPNAQAGKYGNALYAAAYHDIHGWDVGLSLEYEAIVKLLLEHGANPNMQAGEYGQVLHAASFRGHEVIVKLLLENGANPNAQAGKYGNALYAAAYHDIHGWDVGPSLEYEAIVKLLLEHGANPNMQAGEYGQVLHAASFRGHEVIVKLLLENGADPNTQAGKYSNALQVASFNGYEAIMTLLLDNGADLNAQGGEYGNALQAASFKGHKTNVELLLSKGANPHAQGGKYGNALQAASCRGHEAIVKLLLENKVDLNVQGGELGNALQAASYGGHNAIVKLFLEHGADPNAQGGKYGNALQAGSLRYDDELESTENSAVVKLLLEHGADVNAQGGEYGNALQAASLAGQVAIVKLLLEYGADPNAQGGKYGNALQAGSLRYDDELESTENSAVVKLLLEHGADVNVQGGEYGNALQAASLAGQVAIVKLLLEHGADPNAQGGKYGNALQAAGSRWYNDNWASTKHSAVVKLLLEHGADVNAQGGEYGNALQVASFAGQVAIVELLLEHGADPNAQGGKYSNPLQAAGSRRCYDWQESTENSAVVKLLLDHRADVNAQGGEYGNALQAASFNGQEVIVRLLLKHGADPNAQGGEHGTALEAALSQENYAIVALLQQKLAEVGVSS